ncbi:DUF4249 domain-containing protein [Hymenobacter sediminicola]|uniref:DUF4249 domain-containing protein n=1 Tax=Hymenobacter sediminicola TaxID=2761579 RepID=A0A7G7W6L1_9BACT|nr:DUF4249 domain-containing protein [Hymenobacter sediminicola]QNH62004.1 DUF4249 domain-containing protein [Hymenobacter sediminicola]
MIRFLSLPLRLVVLCCGALLLLLPGCIDPYMPDGLSGPPNYLVVDGFLNSQGVTTIKLSRTYGIDTRTAPPVEARASVAIEQEAGPRIPLQEAPAGTYTSSSTVLNTARKYRLHIVTQDGKQYASEYVPVKNTPPIDSVTWTASSSGLDIQVNTHDETNNTQYYRWDYDETWEIVPLLTPLLEYVNNTFRPLTTPYPRICWGNQNSTAIDLTKTTNLSQDIVSKYSLRSYPATSERLRHTYSILVRQYAQTQEEYRYWEMLKKNTENIGTLFDPLPSQITGNVRCLTDESELAMGYVGAYSVQQKRIFIRRAQLPNYWRVSTGYDICIPPDTVEYKDVRGTFNYKLNIPLYEIPGKGYLATGLDCVDCRLRGTSVKPSFWP